MLLDLISSEIRQQGGSISFAKYMDLALYAPGLGYYASGLRKLGEGGDFTTAPEISPLFAYALTRQIQPVLMELGGGDILEFGAGSGKLAADLLTELEKLSTLPTHYYILELSAELRDRQQQWLQKAVPHLFDRVIWLDTFPSALQGIIIANEVMDAMPVHRFCYRNNAFWEYRVGYEQGKLIESLAPPHVDLVHKLDQLNISFEEDYTSEISLLVPAWVASLAAILERGLVLLIDYGFPRHEYYHPQRSMGTLMCHYRHQAHGDPYVHLGQQDITAHIDFTAVEEAAISHGFDVAGYATQANFLLSCGIMDIAANMQTSVEATYRISQQIKRLLLPSEMGELFKVMALTKKLSMPFRF